MSIKLTRSDGALAVYTSAKTFCDILVLARSKGWKPEGFPKGWPHDSSGTELLVREIDGHSGGAVSNSNARGLIEALSRVSERKARARGPDLCMAILDFSILFRSYGFTVTREVSGATGMNTRWTERQRRTPHPRG